MKKPLVAIVDWKPEPRGDMGFAGSRKRLLGKQQM